MPRGISVPICEKYPRAVASHYPEIKWRTCPRTNIISDSLWKQGAKEAGKATGAILIIIAFVVISVQVIQFTD